MRVHHFPDRFVLEYDRYALVLHTPSSPIADPEHIHAEFVPASEALPGTNGEVITAWEGLGCLGIAQVDGEHYVAVAMEGTPIARNTSGHSMESVVSLSDIGFFCLGRPDLDPDATHSSHPCHSLHKLLTSGQSYVALDPGYDLTQRVRPIDPHQPKARDPSRLAADPRFIANHAWLAPLRAFRSKLSSSTAANEFDRVKVAMVILHGYVGMRKVTLAGQEAILAVISRKAYQREGTRFAERGIDANGFCANYAETETNLLITGRTAHFVQVRGSVPVFWTERGSHGLFGPDVTLTDVTDVDEERAMERHFGALVNNYGKIECLNLLWPKREGELSRAYKRAYEEMSQRSPGRDARVGYREFDFHDTRWNASAATQETALQQFVEDGAEEAGISVNEFTFDVNKRPMGVQTVQRQETVWRTNCRDCLDRTNLAQNQISLIALTKFLMTSYSLGPDELKALESAHRELFAENGDALSLISTGAPAMNSTFLRTGDAGLANTLANDANKVRRDWNWEFKDEKKERVIRQFEAIHPDFALSSD